MTRPLKRVQLPRARARSIRAASCTRPLEQLGEVPAHHLQADVADGVLAHLLGDDRPRRVLPGRAEDAVEVLPAPVDLGHDGAVLPQPVDATQ